MEELIPITMFIVIGAAVVAYFYWNHRNRVAIMETVQKAVQGGNTLTPELLDRLGAAADPRLRDLRRGIVLFFIGLAFLLATLFVDEPEIVSGFRAFSMLPIMMGLGFLLVWKLTPDRP